MVGGCCSSSTSSSSSSSCDRGKTKSTLSLKTKPRVWQYRNDYYTINTIDITKKKRKVLLLENGQDFNTIIMELFFMFFRS